MAYPYASSKDEVLSRLRKIEGQVRGIHRMVDEDSYCVDILTQISAVISGMEKVGVRLLRGHVAGCVKEALEKGKDGDEKLDELVKVVERFVAS